MDIGAIGIDMVSTARIRSILTENNEQFMANTFSLLEQEYCRSHTDPAPHFAGHFAAKEAVRKATGNLSLAFKDTEVRHATSGKPGIWMDGIFEPSILISITHTDTDACAIAFINKK